jgi:poly(3-hydroxybutyrate) depolymerase
MEQTASDYGWYVITPVGTKEPLIQEYGWNTFGIKCGSFTHDDFHYFDEILKFIDTELCGDVNRVYSTGFSTGAFHSNALACTRANKLAGISTVAGSVGRLYMDQCKNGKGGLDVLQFHSKDDKTVPYDGNAEWHTQPEVTDMWEDRNGCRLRDVPRVTYLSDTTVCRRKECEEGAVEECTLRGLDHCWPGGRSGGFETPGSCKPQRGDVDATVHMLEFWEEQWNRRQMGENVE